METVVLGGLLAVVAALCLAVLLQLRAVDMRVARLEGGQDTASADLATTLQRLHGDISLAREGLSAVQAQALARQDLERRTAESIRRLELVIAGTQSKGAAGEHLLDTLFSQLPPEWQVRDFRVGDRPVEFGLRLPNQLVLPIDSKWPATSLLERLAAAEDLDERAQLKREIEREVLARAREVKKYLDPARTARFGVLAVPDAVFELCPRAAVDALSHNVAVVAYSMLVPYLLLAFETALLGTRELDLERLQAHLATVEDGVRTLQEELDGRYARALTMLQNARSDMGAQLGRLGVALASARLGPAPDGERPPLRNGTH